MEDAQKKSSYVVYVLDESLLVGSLLVKWLEQTFGDSAVALIESRRANPSIQSTISSCDLAIVVCGYPDLNLPVRVQQLRLNGVPIALLASYGARISIPYLIAQGITGFLSTSASFEQLHLAIKTLLQGRKFISPEMVDCFVERTDDCGLRGLSDRELSLLTLIARGMENKAIADSLNLSPKTIYTYKHRIYTKLGIRNDVQALLVALRRGLVKESGLVLPVGD